MTGQLDLFAALTLAATITEPDAHPNPEPDSPTSDDDGSLHWMLTGQPQPRRDEAA